MRRTSPPSSSIPRRPPKAQRRFAPPPRCYPPTAIDTRCAWAGPLGHRPHQLRIPKVEPPVEHLVLHARRRVLRRIRHLAPSEDARGLRAQVFLIELEGFPHTFRRSSDTYSASSSFSPFVWLIFMEPWQSGCQEIKTPRAFFL